MHIRSAILLSIVLSVGAESRAANWYAATNGSGGAGTDWSTAFTNVQDALNVAGSNDTIYLAADTFRCPSPLNWTNSFLSIQGGYAGDGTPGTLIDTPTVLTRTGGVMRILAVTGVTNSTLSRVTITDGFTTNMGGGLYVTHASGLTFSSCNISNNRAYLNGGGVYISDSTNIAFVACQINSNRQQDVGTDWVYRYGGGLYALNSYGLVSNSVIRANVAQYSGHNSMYGGGVSLIGGGWDLADCTLAYNAVMSWGTGARVQGGAVYISGGGHTIHNVLLIGNDVVGTTTGGGDGISSVNASLSILNSTLYANVGEGVRQSGGTLMITNSILWHHMGGDVAGAATLGFVNTETGLSNGVNGCISSDPLFENGVYLAVNSPCINAGSTTAAAAGMATLTTQSDGTPDAGVVDLGYHHPVGITVIPDLYVAESGLDANDGLSSGTAYRTITKALTAATAGTRIHVASGLYTNGLETFPLNMTKHGVQLLGTNSESTIINAAGSSQRVLSITELFGGRIEGLSLKGGNSTGLGGGVNISLVGDLNFESCVISSNTSVLGGGGICIKNSCGIGIEACVLAENDLGVTRDWGVGYGGGLYASESKGVLSNCFVQGNHTYFVGAGTHGATRGGGIGLVGGFWTVSACAVSSNRTAAAAVFNNGWGFADGAGVYVAGGTHRFQNSLIVSNDCYQGYDGTRGDGVYVANAVVAFLSCTLADNGGEGIYQLAGTVAVTNSILWNNGDDVTGTVTLAYSDIEDGDNVGVNGCISNNPAFIKGYHLPLGSPCFNTGIEHPWMVGALDLDGNPRLANGNVDMGAYETVSAGMLFLIH